MIRIILGGLVIFAGFYLTGLLSVNHAGIIPSVIAGFAVCIAGIILLILGLRARYGPRGNRN